MCNIICSLCNIHIRCGNNSAIDVFHLERWRGILIKQGFINIELMNCCANDDIDKVGHFA